MNNIVFEGSKILKFEFINEKVEREGSFEIGNTLNFSVNNDEENKKCNCVCTLEMQSNDPQIEFIVNLKMVGFFSHELDDKNQLHIQTTNEFFPYVQSTVSSLMTTFGFPNFMLPTIRFSEEDVDNIT